MAAPAPGSMLAPVDQPDWRSNEPFENHHQVTCWATTDYETEPTEGLRELWQCHRQIRYTAEKRPYFKHKNVVKHRQFLGPWQCVAHNKVRDY